MLGLSLRTKDIPRVRQVMERRLNDSDFDHADQQSSREHREAELIAIAARTVIMVILQNVRDSHSSQGKPSLIGNSSLQRSCEEDHLQKLASSTWEEVASTIPCTADIIDAILERIGELFEEAIISIRDEMHEILHIPPEDQDHGSSLAA